MISFKEYLNEEQKITVDTTDYEFSYSKKPKGKGNWSFYLDETFPKGAIDYKSKKVFSVNSPMSYSEALKQAKIEAKRLGVSKIFVLS